MNLRTAFCGGASVERARGPSFRVVNADASVVLRRATAPAPRGNVTVQRQGRVPFAENVQGLNLNGRCAATDAQNVQPLNLASRVAQRGLAYAGG
jgi:hypothetical protein